MFIFPLFAADLDCKVSLRTVFIGRQSSGLATGRLQIAGCVLNEVDSANGTQIYFSVSNNP